MLENNDDADVVVGIAEIPVDARPSRGHLHPQAETYVTLWGGRDAHQRRASPRVMRANEVVHIPGGTEHMRSMEVQPNLFGCSTSFWYS